MGERSRAVVVSRAGGPEVLQLEQREVPRPGPGQVRVRVSAAGVNYIDVYFRTGLYPRPAPRGHRFGGNACGEGIRAIHARGEVA